MSFPAPSNESQNNYPSRHALCDPAGRRNKAAKILAALEHAGARGLESARCLDVGCASGLITGALAPSLGQTIGLEYDATLLVQASPETLPANALLVRGDGMALPVEDSSLDLVICAQVYEHVSDADRLVQEIYRVLKPGGRCFFSGPNRLDPIERHYGLPFVSWLPRPLADAYLRLTKRGDAYRERPRSYWALKRLWHRFSLVDLTVEMLKQPDLFHCSGELGGLHWVSRLPRGLLGLMRPFYPNYNWVLTKPLDAEMHW